MIELEIPTLTLKDNSEFGEWKKVYLQKRKLETNETQYTNLLSISKHTIPLDDMLINEIKTCHIDYFLSNKAVNLITGKTLSKKTLKNIRDFISNVFKFAIENDILLRNVAEARPITTGKPKKGRRQLTKLEKRLVEQYKEHYFYPAVMILLYTGMRRGELVALEWFNIQFDERVIVINSSIYSEHGKFKLKEGAKTEAGIRLIPIPDILYDVLVELKCRATSNFVFPRKNGEMHSESSWRRAWESYLKYINQCYYNEKTEENRSLFHPAGIPKMIKFTAHMLRHTYTTTLYCANVKIKDAQNWLGHANASTTLDVYTHIEKSIVNQNAAHHLNNFISGS